MQTAFSDYPDPTTLPDKRLGGRFSNANSYIPTITLVQVFSSAADRVQPTTCFHSKTLDQMSDKSFIRLISSDFLGAFFSQWLRL